MGEAIETKRPWKHLAGLIAAEDAGAVRTFVAALEPIDTVRAVAQLSDDDRARLFAILSPEEAADVLEHIPEELAGPALEVIEPVQAARILEELSSANQADLLGELDAEDAETILAEMAPAEARGLRELVAYDEDSAGGLMVREVSRVRAGSTVAEVVRYLQAQAEEASHHGHVVYVEDGTRRLLGAVDLRDLLLSPPQRPVDALMTRDPATVRDGALLAELVPFFEQEHVYGVPVVDAGGVLVGLLRRAAVEEAMAEHSEEDYRLSQGILGGEELRSMPLLLRSRRRLSWLTINIALNLVAASVIALHQDTLQAVIALSVFLPIISDMSGCSGNQAVAVSIRELTLGAVRPADVWRVLQAEIKVGLVNGSALGLMIGAAAFLWKGNAWLGLVVGAALAVNTVVAVAIGASIPLLLKRAGRDPALASGPILTTVTDTTGFFLVLTAAALSLEHLG